MVCDHHSIFHSTLSTAEKCLVISKACSETQEVVNFYSLYFCYLPYPWVMTLLLAVTILVIFTSTCGIIEEFIAPAIVYIVKTLKMSDALAGVTLLAFANGLGDIITAVVASGTDEAVSYNTGSLFGSGLFVMTVVVYFCVRNLEKSIKLPKGIIYRDIGIYIVSTVFMIYCAYKGEITIVDSLVLIALYCVIVITVLIEDKRGGGDSNVPYLDCSQSVIDEEEAQRLHAGLDAQQVELMEVIRRSSFRRILFSMADTLMHKRQIRVENGWDHEKIVAVLLEWIDFPSKWIRRLTIPPCNEEEYDSRYLFIWPFLGIPFVLVMTLGHPQLSWLLCVPVAALISGIFYRFSPEDRTKTPSFFFLITMIGSVLGILWTKLICEVMIDSLNFIGVMASISSTYLGLTIIAIGNSLPDALTTIALANNGQAILGLTGAYAGQIFGLLMGFGLSMLKKNYTTGQPVKFDLLNPHSLHRNFLCLVVLFTALITMLVTFGWNVMKNFKLTKTFGKIVLGIYIAFASVATLFTLAKAFHVI